MSTPLVVVFPRGDLSEHDKLTLREAGILTVESDHPHDVHQLRLASPLVCTDLNGDAIVRAALRAIATQPAENSHGYIAGAGRAAHTFVQLLSQAMENTSVITATEPKA